MAVPKLRFKEFVNSWYEVKMEDIFENIVEKGYTDKIVFTIVQGIGTVPRAESGRNMIYDEKSISGYKKVNKNDFIIHLRSFEGGLEKANGEGLVSPAYTVLRPKNKVATVFLYDYFHTKKFINGVLAKAVEGIRDGRQISYNMFKWLKIPFTDYAEQKKIAEFLTTFDKRIAAQQNIIADLEETKKGLLQKIFSQEIRFKDDNEKDYPDWEENRLGDVCCHFRSGKSIVSHDIFSKGRYKVFGGNGLRGYSDRYTHDGEYVLIGRQGALCGNINYVDGKNYISEHAIAVQGNEKASNIWLKYNLIHMNLNRYSESSAQPGLSVEKLIKIKIKVPCLFEQQKIADFLSTFDKKITAEQQILSDLQEIKKGLLQQMFV